VSPRESLFGKKGGRKRKNTQKSPFLGEKKVFLQKPKVDNARKVETGTKQKNGCSGGPPKPEGLGKGKNIKIS
jgi:hypothetical protein